MLFCGFAEIYRPVLARDKDVNFLLQHRMKKDLLFAQELVISDEQLSIKPQNQFN